MPAHNYTPVPLEDEIYSRNYNTGVPSTAPPSFHSVPLTSRPPSRLPHRNDETAATIMPQEERPVPQTVQFDDANSVWAPSESIMDRDRDLEAAREDAIARLMERVTVLEMREAEERDGEGGLNGSVEKAVVASGFDFGAGERCGNLTFVVGMVVFFVWLCGTITLAVWKSGSGKSKE